MLQTLPPEEERTAGPKTRLWSRRDTFKLGGMLIAGAATPQHAHASVLIGDPQQPAALPRALLQAYASGARDITIRPGTYVLPDTRRNAIELRGWRNVTIRAPAVTLIFEGAAHRPILLHQCTDLTLEDAVLRFSGIAYTQGKITAMGKDAQGPYVEWKIDIGYPTTINPTKVTYNVIDRSSRLLKVGTGDSAAGQAATISSGYFRLYRISGMMQGAAVGDWLVCRADGGTSIIQLDESAGCTMRGITLMNAGFAAFFETGGEGGHRYLHCRVTRGPSPAGASEPQLVACGADGFHSTGTRVGPTIDHCIWDGVLLDDCIAIHGTFQQVLDAEGNKLILDNAGRNNGGVFAVGEPVRVSSASGFFGQANCITMRSLPTPDARLEVILDKELNAPSDAKAGNPDRCGRSYKILNCTLGNTRSRGILVKADDGLIRDCVIEGCGMSAISIGPEYYWNEANYAWNVVVSGNRLSQNCRRNNRLADGVIFLHGDGAIGNRNITISNNTLDSNYGLSMMSIAWASGVTVSGNAIRKPSPLPMPGPGSLILMHNARHVVLCGNTFTESGPSMVQAVSLGADVEDISGNNSSGIRKT